MSASVKPQRISVGFQGGQVLGLRVAAKELANLERALEKDNDGWYELPATDPNSYPSELPGIIIGHEASAEIIEIGREVTDWSVGDRVAIEPTVFCQHCAMCKAGLYEASYIPRETGGYLAEAVVTPPPLLTIGTALAILTEAAIALTLAVRAAIIASPVVD